MGDKLLKITYGGIIVYCPKCKEHIDVNVVVPCTIVYRADNSEELRTGDGDPMPHDVTTCQNCEHEGSFKDFQDIPA